MTFCDILWHQQLLQGVEQSTANIMYFSLAKKLYPNSGYKSETGGYLRNLRNSTNIQKVRQYHKDFYRFLFSNVYLFTSNDSDHNPVPRPSTLLILPLPAIIINGQDLMITTTLARSPPAFMFMLSLELKTWFLPSPAEWMRRNYSIHWEQLKKRFLEKDQFTAVMNSRDPGPLL